MATVAESWSPPLPSPCLSLFAAEDYGFTDRLPGISAIQKLRRRVQDTRPALLEPALRSLDGVSYHG